MCICVCICANNMQILGFGGVGGLGVGGGYHWGGWGSGDRAHIYIYMYVYILQSIDLYSTLFHLKIRNVHSIHFDSFRCHSCIGTLPPHFHPPRNRWLQEVVAAHPASF